MSYFFKDLQFLEKSLQEFTERKELLGELLEEKYVRGFKEIQRITLIKEVCRRGSCFYAYDDLRSEMVMTRYHFEVKTEQETFFVALEFTNFERHKFSEDFIIWHYVYELYAPQMSQHNTEQIAEKMVAFLKEHRAAFDDNKTFHVLHPFKPFYVKKELSELEIKRFIKAFKKNKPVAYELFEFPGRTSLPLDEFMNKEKEREDDNTERFMRELGFIEEDIQKLTERKERLTQLITQNAVRDFNEIKSITPIKQSVWWSDYYYDFQKSQVIDLDYFEIETEHETFFIALSWAGVKDQIIHKPVRIYHTLYELHAPVMNQGNTEQIAEKMVAYLDEHCRSKHDENPERTVYHVLHAFKRTHEEKALTKFEEKKLIKNKTVLDELEELGESFPDLSPF